VSKTWTAKTTCKSEGIKGLKKTTAQIRIEAVGRKFGST
jgi:hypothetical protein